MLCSGGGFRKGLPIATTVNPSLEIFRDMSGDGLGGYWNGTGMWCYAPIPTHITFDKKLRHVKDFISSGHGEAAYFSYDLSGVLTTP